MAVPVAVTIAGSDSGGGAGIQADLKTFAALGVYGVSVITALTAQNTKGVFAIHEVPAEFVARADRRRILPISTSAAVKIGMLGNAADQSKRSPRRSTATRAQRRARSGHGRDLRRTAAARRCARRLAQIDRPRARHDA